MARHNDGDSEETETDTDTTAELEEGIGEFFDKTVGESGKGGKGGRARAGGDDDDDREGDDEGSDDEGAEESDDDEDEESEDDADDDEDEEDDDVDEDDEGEEDEEEEEESDDDDELDPEVEAAAARHQLPTNFEDIVRTLPKEARAAARQAFQKRLKEVESGLGRAFQEARAERKELARLKAERKHNEDHPTDFIADLIDANPKLLDELNEELENRETKAYREAKKLHRENAKKELERTAEQETAAVEQRRQRGQQVASLAQRLAREAGVPFKLVDRALYAAVMSSAEKDVTDEAIRRIVKQEARDWRKLTGERKTENKKEYIRNKSKQIKDSKRRVSARDRGHAPAPGRRREPKNLREALDRRAASILPDAPE